MNDKNIVVLAGGVGAARFLEGLVQVVDPSCITVIVNTGDDEIFFGLHVSPDIDTIIYTLSGKNNEKQGWGLKDESFTVSKQLTELGNENWFTLGDKDFATHIHRTYLLRKGQTLTNITKNIAEHFSIPFSILPMTNSSVKTMVTTPIGVLSFQEYFVKRHCADPVSAVTFAGIKTAKPTKEVMKAIQHADAIIIAPSNPIVSIGTILAVDGMKDAILQSKAKKIAISPIVGGKTIKGPADTMLTGLGMEASAIGVAKYYLDFLDYLIIDTQDAGEKDAIEKLGISVAITQTIMKDLHIKKALAQKVLQTIR